MELRLCKEKNEEGKKYEVNLCLSRSLALTVAIVTYHQPHHSATSSLLYPDHLPLINFLCHDLPLDTLSATYGLKLKVEDNTPTPQWMDQCNTNRSDILLPAAYHPEKDFSDRKFSNRTPHPQMTQNRKPHLHNHLLSMLSLWLSM